MPLHDRRAALDPRARVEALLLQRVFLAEKWLVARLHYGHVDPREAGVGNIVNCGAAMYVAPVGLANAGDPRGAYAEAIDLAGRAPVELRPRGRGRVRGDGRGSGRPGATLDDVVAAALDVAHDGTRAALARGRRRGRRGPPRD